MSVLSLTPVRVVCVFAAAVLNFFVYTSSVFASWEVVHPRSPKNLIHDACWGDGRFVAVGEFGAIKTSTDGLDWTLQKAITTKDLLAVVFTGTRFVATGKGGTIMRSVDGVNWSLASAPTTADFTRVKVLNGALFAIGLSSYDGVIWRSTDDGNQWVRLSDNLANLSDLVYFGGEYIAMGRQFSNLAWRSTNLQTWTVDPSWNPPISNVAWADVVEGKLVLANGSVIHSVDGINWTPSSWIPGIGKVVAFGGAYYGVKQGNTSYPSGVYRSPNLISWTELNAIGTDVLCSGGGKILAIQNTSTGGDEANVSTDGDAWERYQNWKRSAPIFANGAFRSAVGNFLYSSIDGVSWTSVRLPNGFNASGIYYSNGKYFVPGSSSSQLLVSSDMSNWTAGNYRVPHAPVFAFGKWFAGGRQSLDGLTWTTVLFASGVAAGNGILVSVLGASNLFQWWTSTNGSTWTKRSLDETGGSSIAFGNGIFVCVGPFTWAIRTSIDGVTWTTRSLPPGSQLYEKVRFENGRFVASGNGGTIGWSLDGITWHAANYPVWGVMNLPAYGNSIWLTTGQYVSLRSTDLVNWTQLTNYSGIEFAKVRYLNGEFWALDRTHDNIITGSVWRSVDGRVWKPTHSFDFFPVDIAFGNGTYVVTSDNDKASYSTDGGVTWTEVTLADSRLAAITFGLGRFTIVGQGMIFHSADGIYWSSLSIVDGPDFNEIAATSLGLFAVGGYSEQDLDIYRSTDGTTWNPAPPVAGALTVQSYQTITEIGSGVYVGGNNGILIKTTDGSAWTTVLPAGNDFLTNFRSAAVTAEGFVKLSADGALTYTRDLMGFTDFRAIPLGTSRLTSIAVGDGILVGVGDHGSIVRCDGYLDLAPIEYWRKQAFGITSATGIAADSADPDSDGKSNLLEYALGCNPKVPDGADAVQTQWDHSGELATGVFTFPCDASRSDVDWEVWLSYDGLSSWVRVARCAKGARCVSTGAWSVNDTYENSSGTGHQRSVMVEVRSDHQAAFLRLGVVRNR